MYLAFYNKEGIGDVLLLVNCELDRQVIATESRGDVTRIYNKETLETAGYNIFDISNKITINHNGNIQLTVDEIETLNQLLYDLGFEDTIIMDSEAKFVIGQVVTSEPHPDSDHLQVTQTTIGNKTLQIVCGAKNCQTGIKVVVALPGAVMPNGQIIQPGKLRGVDSYGMLCSAFELRLEGAQAGQGILILEENTEVGSEFILN